MLCSRFWRRGFWSVLALEWQLNPIEFNCFRFVSILERKRERTKINRRTERTPSLPGLCLSFWPDKWPRQYRRCCTLILAALFNERHVYITNQRQAARQMNIQKKSAAKSRSLYFSFSEEESGQQERVSSVFGLLCS